MADIASQISQYKQQLAQVNELLSVDANNPQFLQLKTDLVKVISLTEQIPRNQDAPVTTSNTSSSSGSSSSSSHANEEDAQTGPIVVGEVVEVVGGDRSYAGVITEVINETEYKLKYYEYQSEVSLPITSIARFSPIHELIKPRSSIEIGTTCQCKFAVDQQFHEVMVTDVTAHGFQVMYTAYGNTEEVPYEYLKEMPKDGHGYTTGIIEPKKDVKKDSKGAESALIPIPANLWIKPTDTEEEKERKKKKIKAIKSKNRLIGKDMEVQEVQKTWQSFVTKSSKKKITAVAAIAKKGSMFKSPTDVFGKVGVTNSGKTMTTFTGRKKYAFEGGEG